MCALKHISLTCNFTPRTSRLYLCCDIGGDSYVRNRTIPVLRNIEIETRYKKLKSETFEEAVYLPVNVSYLNAITLYLLDEDLQPITFNPTTSIAYYISSKISSVEVCDVKQQNGLLHLTMTNGTSILKI